MFFGGGGRGGFPFGGGFDDDEGGDPFAGMRGGRGPPKEVENSKYYEILGVDKKASMDEIKKAYRKKAIKMHPDKGGDQEEFQKLQQAYDTLFDKDKREVYDKYGEDGIKKGMGGGGGDGDIFSQMFGGGGGRPKQKRQVKPQVKEVEISLADAYNGCKRDITVDRQRLCSVCNGIGGTDATAVKTCTTCRGQGMVTKMRQMGPGMYSQSTQPCDDCDGAGEIINLEKRCKTCKGKKIKRDKKKIEQEIDKGCPHKEQYTISGEGDCVPDVEPGDVIVVVKVRDNKIYKRKGADLYMEKEISLLEALTGVDFTIMHLDGRIIKINNTKGQIVKPGQKMTVEGLGMPFHKTSYKFGNLFITFKIKFPDTMTSAEATTVANVLKTTKLPSELQDIEACKETV
jgi:DnaJ homolog subfamily A member 2